jgi:glycosyltransferase involved in cell wall biosynthesis
VRVACIIHSLDGGGAERVMASLCSHLASRGHEVTLITLDNGRRQRHRLDSAVQWNALDLMSNSRDWISRLAKNRMRVARIRQAIIEAGPELVVSFCDRTNILSLMAARGLSIPVIACERSDPAQQNLGRAWEWLRARTYRHAAAIVALTNESAEHLRSRFAVPISVIPSAVDAPPIDSDRVSAGEAKRIIAAGRLEYEKGFDRLLTAFSQLPASDREWSVRILGEGSQRSNLETQIKSLGLQGRVSMPGWVDSIWEELAAATFFVLPSRYEGFPSALMEAMAVGVPSLAVDCPSGPREIIRQSDWGLLVANEIDALSEGMQRMMHQSEFREQLGQAGRRVTEQFSWDRMVDRYEELMCQVIADAKGIPNR